jgi:hypothetical protein
VKLEDFEKVYNQLKSSCLPCAMRAAAAAEASDLEDTIDFNRTPSDPRTAAAAMALDELTVASGDDNVKFFAKLFSLHLCAADLPFQELLQFGAVAMMVASAFDVWTVCDPMLLSDAIDAQNEIAQSLEIGFTRVAYSPFWVCANNIC